MIFFVKYRCCVLWIWREWETYCWSLIMNFRFEFREKSLESHPPCVLGTLQFHLLPPQRRVARRRITYDVILLSSTSLPETHSTANFVHEKLYTKILFSSLGTHSKWKHTTWIFCVIVFFSETYTVGETNCIHYTIIMAPDSIPRAGQLYLEFKGPIVVCWTRSMSLQSPHVENMRVVCTIFIV